MSGASNYAIANKVRYQQSQRPGKPETLLPAKGLVGVVGLHALPGTTQNSLEFRAISDAAVRDAKRFYQAGFRSLLLQNPNDLPMYQPAGKYITAYMTAVGYAIRQELPDDCVLGVSVLRDDAEAMVSIASAIEADFIRPKTYVGTVVGMDGVHDGCMNQVLEMRYRLKCDVQVWCDVHDRSTSPLGDVDLVDACQQAVSQGLADALNIAGKDYAESLRKIDLVKQNMKGVYVFLGGGANGDNLKEVYTHADGIYVSSCLRESGNMTGALDDGCLEEFMKAYRAL